MKRNLIPEVEALLDKPDDERIAYAQQDKWVGYPFAKALLDKMVRLLSAPRTIRVKSMIVVGDPNAGKTTIKLRFLNLNPPVDSENGDRTIFSVLHIEANSKADPIAFCKRILDALGVPYGKKDSFECLSKQVLDVLRETSVRMIVIDEFHNFLVGRQDMKDALRNTMRTISNELRISFLAFGVPSALQFIAEENQMSSRFKRAVIPRWDTVNNMKTFQQLLASLESTLPLRKASNLHQKGLVEKLINMSEGILGEVVDILEEATIMAIEEGDEQITPALLDSLGWITPTERLKFANES